MKDKIAYILAYLCLSILLNWVSVGLVSDFITKFPGAELITLMVTMFAINVATSNFIISKIHELRKASSVSFNESIDALKYSMLEQVILVLCTFFLLILRSSKVLLEYFNGNSYSNVINILITFVLLYSIDILWHTGKSMFLISKPQP